MTSKRRSARRNSRPQPEPLTYFSDRDLAKKFPLKLRSAGVTIVGYHDQEAYPDDPAISDWEWIRFACSKGWVCLTHDRATQQDNTLDEVFKRWQPSGALFILRGGVSTLRLADHFLAVQSSIERITLKHRRRNEPFIGVVRRATRRGGVEEIEVKKKFDAAGWEEWKSRRTRG